MNLTPLEMASTGRRAVLGRGLIAFFGSSFGVSTQAAELDVFPRINEGRGVEGGNVLTSRLLEKVRVKRQIDADSKYDELAAPIQSSSPRSRLAAVLAIIDTFVSLRPAISKGSPEDWQAIVDILSQVPFDKTSFKRIFNAFADNIYYEKSDPDRANAYLLGGAVPSNKQTIQYLYRNDALDNIEQLRSELSFLLNEQGEGGDANDITDALNYHDKATTAFTSYLALIPEADIRDARNYLLNKQQENEER